MVLTDEFANHFETDAPKITQLEEAIADTLARWPVGSLGENQITATAISHHNFSRK